MKSSRVQMVILLLISPGLAGREACGQEPDDEPRKIAVEAVRSKGATITQQYVCQIRSRRHIDIQALAKGHVATNLVGEGQAVKRGDLLFRIEPPAGQDEQDKDNQDKFLFIKAPFDGLIGRLVRHEGSFVEEGDPLTTLSDNGVMWVYFNVPERRYLEYMAEQGRSQESPDIELILADRSKFPQKGKIGAIDAKFNPETGNIAFRADFPNPDGLLRHGQGGTVVINRVLKDAIVIPQRATFEDLDKRYVYVVDAAKVAHRREIVIQHEQDDLFVIKKGVEAGDKIVVDGVKLVRDGARVK